MGSIFNLLARYSEEIGGPESHVRIWLQGMQKTQQKGLRTVNGPFNMGKLPPAFILQAPSNGFLGLCVL